MNLLVRKDLQQLPLGHHPNPLEGNEGLQMTDHIVHSKGNKLQVKDYSSLSTTCFTLG